MTFSEYALGLYPYISQGQKYSTYFTELIGNFISKDSMDSCQILKHAKDTRYRYVKGLLNIKPKHAQYLYDNRDYIGFPKWILKQIYESSSFSGVTKWLNQHQVEYDNPEDACTKLLEDIILELSKRTTVPKGSKNKNNDKSSTFENETTTSSQQAELSKHLIYTFKREFYSYRVDNFLQNAHESLKLYHHEYETIDFSSLDAANEILEQEMRKQTLPQYVLSMVPKVERFLTNIQRVIQNVTQFNITEEAAKCVFIDIRQYIDTLQCFISDFEKFVKYRESPFSFKNTMTAFDLDDSLKYYESKLNDLFASITKA